MVEDLPQFLDRRPVRPNAEDDAVIGVIPAECPLPFGIGTPVDPKEVSALIAGGLGGGKRQYGIADAVLALFAQKGWHVIREG